MVGFVIGYKVFKIFVCCFMALGVSGENVYIFVILSDIVEG